MSQDTVFGQAEAETFIEVRKADGRLLHYRITPDGQTLPITPEDYQKGTS